MVKLRPVHRYSVDIFHIMVHQEYWVLADFPLVLTNRLNKTESAVFFYCLQVLSISEGSVFSDYLYCIEGGLDCHRTVSRLPLSGIQITIEGCLDCQIVVSRLS